MHKKNFFMTVLGFCLFPICTYGAGQTTVSGVTQVVYIESGAKIIASDDTFIHRNTSSTKKSKGEVKINTIDIRDRKNRIHQTFRVKKNSKIIGDDINLGFIKAE